MADEKTEEPTDKKLQDAKKKGQHAKSQDTTAALSLLGMTIVLSSAAAFALQKLATIVTRMLDGIAYASESSAWMPMMIASLADGLVVIAIFSASAILLGLVGSAAQVGISISFEPLAINFDKINPGSGLKKLISMKSIIEFVKMVIKAIALAAVLWNLLQGRLPALLSSPYLSPDAIAALGWSSLLKLFGGAVIVFMVIAPLDFALQKFQFLKDQRMTKDEIKREHKESEGDPQLKGKRKQLAHEMANAPPSKTVPGASVVVTNPTHYAVALKYVPGVHAAPIVVAKGMDDEALRIRRIAEEHRVPIVSDPPLARALHTLRLSEPIPEKLYEAVAAILRWVAMVKLLGA